MLTGGAIRNVELYKENNGRTRYLTEAEAKTLLEASSRDLRLVILGAMHTGFRSKELKTLRWCHVDFANRSATVQSCYAKNGETRTVPLTPDLYNALQSVHNERKPGSDDFVFVRTDGQPWKCWKEAFKGALKRAGITDFKFHDLRHCYGSWLAMNNVSDKGRMELMGHRDPKMTLRYTHLSMDYKRQAVERLPQFGTSVLEWDTDPMRPPRDTPILRPARRAVQTS
jgi:integrase